MENEYRDYRVIESERTIADVSASFATLMRNVYIWMTGGLIVTALTAMVVANNPALVVAIFGTPFAFWGIFIAELALVWILASRIDRLSFLTASCMFVVYSILTGLTLSVIFLAYTLASIAQVFFISAGTFAAMSVVGFVTKKDLSTLGRILIMALIGLIIASVVNLFMHNTGLDLALNYLGVAIFVGLTAYDTQKIKNMLLDYGNTEVGAKLTVLASLTLYLDFINLFLYLLRLLGDRR